jgi:hypothetical protein
VTGARFDGDKHEQHYGIFHEGYEIVYNHASAVGFGGDRLVCWRFDFMHV